MYVIDRTTTPPIVKPKGSHVWEHLGDRVRLHWTAVTRYPDYVALEVGKGGDRHDPPGYRTCGGVLQLSNGEKVKLTGGQSLWQGDDNTIVLYPVGE